jgi:hypothetical protein
LVADDGSRWLEPLQPAPGEPLAGPWIVRPLARIAAELVASAGRHAGSRRPLVIAVDGRSAAGKTTLAARLAAAIDGATVVHTDDVAWYESFFGWDRLLRDGVLEPARAGRAVAYRPPPWDERGRAGAIAVPAGCRALILEGVGAGRRELSDLLDALVWVQSDAARARARGIERDGGDVAFWDEWDAEEVPFLARDRPWERADLIVAGARVLAHDLRTELVVSAG